MIACPVVCRVLKGHRLEEHKHNAKRKARLVRAVRPQSMTAGRDAKAGRDVQRIGEQERVHFGGGEDQPEAVDGLQVHDDEQRDVAPVVDNLAFVGVFQLGDVGEQTAVDGLRVILVQHSGELVVGRHDGLDGGALWGRSGLRE